MYIGIHICEEEFYSKAILYIKEMSSELAECEVYLSQLERILITLAGGRLPPTLVPATLLRLDYPLH